MSSKLFAVCVAVSLVASVGCQGVFVPKADYDRNMEQRDAYIQSLERDNAEMHAKLKVYEARMDPDAAAAQAEAYKEMAAGLKKALEGLDVGSDVFVDSKTGAIIFAEKLLFDLGSYTITAKGRDVLKRFAETHRQAQLRIAGHTDSTKVVRDATKKSLPLADNNLELSVMRADAVAYELIKHGIPERNIVVEGWGFSSPRPDRASSRRVEIFVVGAPAGKVSKP